MGKINYDVSTMPTLDSQSKLLDNKVKVSTNENYNIEKSFERTLTDLQNTWLNNTIKAKELVPKIPTEYRPIFELQQSIYRCHLQTEIITKVGDGIQSTLKKLQNQGG